jgi:hypothetical protein
MACLFGAGAAPLPFPQAGPAPAPAPAPGSIPGISGDAFQNARKLCVDKTNEFRARVGAPPLGRNGAQESCNDQQAKSDGSTNAIHGAFGRCNESAQNECPNWPGPADAVVGPCLQQMFDEGPGGYADHGHYINMTNRQYKSVSCGFYVTPSGSVWVIQDFY